MNATKELTLRDAVDRLVTSADSLESRVDRLARDAAEVYDKINGASEEEVNEIRTRLTNTEDALRREIRKNLNAPACCPSCGVSLASQPKKVTAT